MFGYVKPFQNELKVKEYELYKAVYCGLCKELKRLYGPGASFILSYDLSFLALLQMGLQEDTALHFERERCLYNPCVKKGVCHSNEALSFAAGMACLTFYHKVKDNIADSPFPKKIGYWFLLPFASRLYKKAQKQHPKQAELIAGQMSRQRTLEQEGCPSVDEAAEPTAVCLSSMCAALAKDETEERILKRLGYFLGRWIYLCDALDDLEEDLKHGSYNPFLKRSDGSCQGEEGLAALRQDALGTLNLTLAELVKSYDLLTVYRFKPILDNIIYLGLRGVQTRVITQKETEKA